jgi:hypothetical protein
MKISKSFHRRVLLVGIFIFGLWGGVAAVAGQAAPDLSGKWTGFTPTGVNGGENTFTQSGANITMRHPNGQTTGATIIGASTLAVQAWGSTGSINSARTRIVFQGGSMNGWTFVKEGAADDNTGGSNSSSGSLEGTYIDQSDPLTMKPPAIWVIKKLADGQYQAKIQEAPPGGYVAYTLTGNYSNGDWSGKITATNGTFDGWEAATFRLKVSDDRKTITGAYTYWNNWATYNYKIGATKK